MSAATLRSICQPIAEAPKDGSPLVLAHFTRNGDGPEFLLWAEDAVWVGDPKSGAWDLTECGAAHHARWPATHWVTA